DFVLTVPQLIGPVGQLLDAFLHTLRARLLQSACSAIQLLKRGIALRARPTGRSTHGIGRLLHLLRGALQLGRVLLASEPLQSTRLLFSLLGHFALLRTATTARGRLLTETLGKLLLHALQSLVLLLLTAGELLEAFERFVDFL